MTMAAHEILDHFRVPNFFSDDEWDVYLLLCGANRITVRSQQIRALNLIYALHHEQKFNPIHESRSWRPCKIAVIGGGAAGLTAAAAAAALGAQVTLFEKSSQLMDLQMGCWHRPLHPEIRDWPNVEAYRPVSHLPLLGWTTGSAHQVAAEIVTKFWRLATDLGITVEAKTRAKVGKGQAVYVPGKEYSQKFDRIILAVGFGVEAVRTDLPLNSYWRVDSLDQSLLEAQESPCVLVSGSGDGGIIDVLRAGLTGFDTAAVLDTILSLTVDDADLIDHVNSIERNWKRNDWAAAETLLKGYQEERGRSVANVDSFLNDRLREGHSITWLFDKNHFLAADSLPINRFLIARMLKLIEGSKSNSRITIDKRPGSEVAKIAYLEGQDKPYHATIQCTQCKATVDLDFHRVIIRHGSRRRHVGSESLLESIVDVFDLSTPELKDESVCRLLQGEWKRELHSAECHTPYWQQDGTSTFASYLELSPVHSPQLRASFIENKKKGDWLQFEQKEPWAEEDLKIYRIKIWLEGGPPKTTVRYDLHPKFHKVVSRTATGPDYEMWLNTWGDYDIRIQAADGQEWYFPSLLAVLGSTEPKPIEKADVWKQAIATIQKQTVASNPRRRVIDMNIQLEHLAARIQNAYVGMQRGVRSGNAQLLKTLKNHFQAMLDENFLFVDESSRKTYSLEDFLAEVEKTAQSSISIPKVTSEFSDSGPDSALVSGTRELKEGQNEDDTRCFIFSKSRAKYRKEFEYHDNTWRCLKWSIGDGHEVGLIEDKGVNASGR